MSSTPPLTTRRVTRISVVDIDTDILLPESVLLLIEPSTKGKLQSLDVGSFCYPVRESLVNGRKLNEIRLVNEVSLSSIRKPLVLRLINHLRELVALEGKSHNTALNLFSIATSFIDFCDGNCERDIFNNIEGARHCLIDYSRDLEHKIQLPIHHDNALNLNTAAAKQRKACEIISVIHDVSSMDVITGIRKIRKSKFAVNQTKLIAEDKYSWALKVQYALFDGLSDLVIKNLPVPYFIDMPDQRLWFFHDLKIPTASNERTVQLAQSQFPREHIDYKNGKVLSLSEARDISSNPSDYIDNSKRTNTLIDNMNNNHRHNTRKGYALIAVQAFFIHFIAHTGLNVSVAANISWNDDYQIGSNVNGWRVVTIKRRGNREVIVEIGSKFKAIFLKYIELRKWILNGRSSPFLFAVEGKDLELGQIPDGTPKQYKNRLKKFYPECPWVTPKQLRKYKGVWVLKTTNGDLKIAADVLQNSIGTIEKHYSEGDELTASEEFEKLWVAVRSEKLALIRNKNCLPTPINVISENYRSTKTMVGACKSFNNPSRSAEFNQHAIKPDCTRPDGCLFCEHFAIHCDDTDLRKLISCHECLESLKPNFDSEDHYLSEYGVITQRIEEIVDQLKSIGDEKLTTLINRISVEVRDDGILDPWWSRRMEMLINIGAVTQ